MAKYRLKPGFTHYEYVPDHGHRSMKAGDTCELTESQVEAFGDRFEPVGQGLKAEADAKPGKPKGQK